MAGGRIILSWGMLEINEVGVMNGVVSIRYRALGESLPNQLFSRYKISSPRGSTTFVQNLFESNANQIVLSGEPSTTNAGLLRKQTISLIFQFGVLGDTLTDDSTGSPYLWNTPFTFEIGAFELRVDTSTRSSNCAIANITDDYRK